MFCKLTKKLSNINKLVHFCIKLQITLFLLLPIVPYKMGLRDEIMKL